MERFLTVAEMRILLAEDHESWQKAIENLLTQEGFYHITPVSSNAAAYTALSTSQTPFHLIITDNSMPNKGDGVELLQFLRRRYGNTPSILHSSDTSIMRSPDLDMKIPEDVQIFADAFPNARFIEKMNLRRDLIPTIQSLFSDIDFSKSR